MLKRFFIPFLGILGIFVLLPTQSFAEEPEISAISEEEALELPNISETKGPMVQRISDPSGWQSRGKYGNNVYTSYTKRAIPSAAGVNWISAGGNFQVRFTGLSIGNSFTAQLMEYDPGQDDYVGDPVRIDEFKNVLNATGISGYVDGDSNNEAEFYVHIYNAWEDDYVYAEGFD
ncbi:hypothetical protein NDK25_23690 [Niallia taxi]|nr:hypothetical protein [Niallia taxi]MDE5055221.1 hypothetical protein [Niallia taxi]